MRVRRAAGTAAVVLCAPVLSAALVLFAGFVYQAVTGHLAGRLIAWCGGLLVASVVLFGVFGATLPDEGENEDEGEDVVGGKVQDREDDVPAEERAPAGADDDLPTVGIVLALLGLVAGGAVGMTGYEALRPPAATRPEGRTQDPSTSSPSPTSPATGVAWKVPAVGDRYDQGPGAWGLGDTVAQGRLDGLHAYDVRDGAVRWSVPAPAREALCAMSPDAEGDVGLIAYGRHEKPCATVLAVHTGTGNVLWRQPLTGTGLAAGALAVGGSTAVVAEEGAVRGRSSESGEQRWQRILAKNCEARAVEATEARTLLVEQCGSGARLVALDTRTGTEHWTRALPVESGAEALVVSVAPVVVAVHEADTRGTRALLAFDDRGAPTVSVPMVVPEGRLLVRGGGDRALVVGDLLITKVETSSSVSEKVVAHSLQNGRRVWAYASADRLVQALAPQPDGTVGVLGRALGAEIVLLDAATGTVRAEIVPKGESERLSNHPELIPVNGGHAVVNHISLDGEPAVFALR